LLLAASMLAGCAYFDSGPSVDTSARRNRVIDEAAGSYRRLALGDDAHEVHAAFGPRRPARPDESVTPLATGDDTEGPSGIAAPQRAVQEPPVYRYRWVSLSLYGGRVAWMEIVEPGATTAGGVGIGDPIERVRKAYAHARCGTASQGSDFPVEYRACLVRLAPHRWLWFGGDPISTIALSAVPLSGV
jgi:hypothetical protein